MSKSYIGRVILSARSDSYHVSVEGGQGLFIDGAQFDAPSGSPTNGRAIRVSNVDGLTISNCSFYSAMANPGTAHGGSSTFQRGDTSSYREINSLRGQRPRPSDIALVRNSGPDPVKMAMNGFPGYSGIVRGNIVSVDPDIRVEPLSARRAWPWRRWRPRSQEAPAI